MQSRRQLKGQKFWAAVGASPENILGHHPKKFEHPPKIFLGTPGNILRHALKIFLGIPRKYFKASAENILGSPGNILSGLEQFLCNTTNQVCQIRLWGLQPAWHIYCPGKFETLVNLSFHSYIFFVPGFTKTVGF